MVLSHGFIKMRYSKRLAQFCATLIGILAIIGELLSPCYAGQQNSFVLRDKSFSIRSSITGQSEIARPLIINEHYSVGQRRARLQFGGESNIAKSFYYDARSEASLIYNPELKLCYGENLDDLYSLRLFEDKEAVIIKLLRMAERSQDVKFIIGPAKLLFLVAHEADNMKQISDSDKDLRNIRNIPVIQYELNLEIEPGNSIIMFVFYNQLTHSPDSRHTEIPVQIAIPSAQVFIDFFGYKLMDELIRSDLTDALELNRDSGLILDRFAFPTSFNCSNEMTNLAPVTLFESYPFGSSRFSFRAESEWDLKSLQHFVAYDGMLQMMRLDTGRKLTNMLSDTTRVLDFRVNRQCTYLNNRTYVTPTKQPMAMLESEPELADPRCIVTRIMGPEKSQRRQTHLHLADLLFEANKFAPMGRARVHGVVARVFESYSNKLPRWLTESLLYRDNQQEDQYKERIPDFRLRFSASSTTLTSDKSEFSIVVYLADEQPLNEADASAGPKLLALEIYDLRISSMKSYRKTLVARVHSFSFELSDAPNGDSVRDLFTLGERCSGDLTNEKYAEVDLLLAQDGEDYDGSPAGSLEWIKHWWLRDAALAIGIMDTLEIQASMMYGLESRYSESPSSRSIGVSFRILDHPMKFYDTIFIGNAELIGETNLTRRFGVNSMVDCLWSVVPSEPVTYILYMENVKTCIVDGDLTGFKADPKESKVFSLDPHSAGELFRIELKYDQEVSLASSWLRDSRFDQIKNRVMVLQNLRKSFRDSGGTSDVRMRIERAKLRNFNYISSILAKERQIGPPSFVYRGFGFHHGSSYTDLAFDSYGKPIDSLLKCQTACLASIRCKSFSFCTRHPHCTLAEASLEAPGTRQLLAYKQQLRSGSKLTIESSEGFMVDLVRDFRCELRNKIYMDLFKPSWLVEIYLGTNQVLPSDSIEQCAEICMGKNLELIKSGITLTGKLDKLLQEGSFDHQGKYAPVLKGLREQHRNSTAKFCAYFMYLDSSLNQVSQKLLMERTNSTEPSEYCVIESDASAEVDDRIQDTQTFQLSTYRFDFSSLYERVPDLQLIDTEKTEEETKAYRAISTGKEASETHYQLLRKSLDEGKNFQLRKTGDANKCGRLCFTQSSGLWPACRSFDIIQQPNEAPWCILNTGSLRDIKSTPDSVAVAKSNLEQVWHYEPIFGLISQELENDFRLDYLREPKQSRQAETVSMSSGSWFVVILVGGLVSGLIFGIYSARWFDIIFMEGQSSGDGPTTGLVMRSVSNYELDTDPDLDK